MEITTKKAKTQKSKENNNNNNKEKGTKTQRRNNEESEENELEGELKSNHQLLPLWVTCDGNIILGIIIVYSENI